jgi:hypothetical protein
MKRITSTFISLSLFLAVGIVGLSAPFSIAGELPGGGYLRTTYSIDTYYESVWGNRLNSTLDVSSDGDAWHYDENLRITFSRPLPSGTGVEFALWGRHTSDRLLQRTPGEEWMANEVRLRLTGETFDIGLGDLSAVYSNYTFNNVFFGASATLRPTNTLTLSALGGINRWPKTDTYGRAFGGIRVEVAPAPGLTLSANYVHTEITDLYPGATVSDYANDVWSAAGRLALMDERLVAAGEIAVSRYVADRRSDDSAEWGSAAWFALSFTPLRNELSILAAWERVDPAFVGAMGAYSTDRETWSIGARYTPSDAFTATAYFRYYEGLVTDYYGAEYHAVTRDPAVTLTWRPFMYDPGSRFTNLALDCTLSYTSERSTDPGNTVSFERIYTHLGLTDTRGPWRFGVVYDLEHDDDLTATDLDTLANTVGFSLGWRHETDRYTLSTDLMAQAKIESVDDNTAGRRYLDVSPRVVAGISAVINPGSDYPTRWSLRYDGIFYQRGYAADLSEHGFEARFEQVFLAAGGITGTLGMDVRLLSVASPQPGLSYGEAVYGAFVRLEF